MLAVTRERDTLNLPLGCSQGLQLAPPDDNDSNEQFARRRYGQSLEERRNYAAQACAAQIAQSMAQRG